jgi:16S rRNA (adenine1518-N6/adenine1519-N6)-dimethyltransferase
MITGAEALSMINWCNQKIKNAKPTMTSPARLLKNWNIGPNKALGQNFLSDPTASERIVSLGGITAEDCVLEIGAGLGALTLALAKTAKSVFAVEKDVRFMEILKAEILMNRIENVDISARDILEFDIAEFAREQGRKIVVAGNLPYNISSQVLVQLVQARHFIRKAVVMLQKELALRIIEPPGSRQYGRISVMMQYCAEVVKIMDIKADRFFPRPKIDSVVLDIRFRESIKFPAVDEEFFFKVVKAAFGQRRKTLRNALMGSELHLNSETSAQVLQNSDIDSARRAESLDVSEFVRLSNIIKETMEI